jgi:pentatricopeptide repeat protein
MKSQVPNPKFSILCGSSRGHEALICFPSLTRSILPLDGYTGAGYFHRVIKLIVLLCAVVFAGSVHHSFGNPPEPRTAKVPADATSANDPVEREYRKLLEKDDESQAEVDKWIRDAQAFEAKGAPSPQGTMRLHILQRFEPVRKSYEDFIQRHPKHHRARLAYGSFLNDLGEEDAAIEQWEKARELNPKEPATWNNLANAYGHNGNVRKAFDYYTRAIELDPKEPVYYWNFATTFYLFRLDAREHYKLTESQVFDYALDLYRKAMKLDPDNFVLATDYAQSYYGITPARWKDGLAAWNQAFKVANDDIEREGVHIHLARIQIHLENFEESRRHLNQVKHSMYDTLKARVSRNLDEREAKWKESAQSSGKANGAQN